MSAREGQGIRDQRGARVATQVTIGFSAMALLVFVTLAWTGYQLHSLAVESAVPGSESGTELGMRAESLARSVLLLGIVSSLLAVGIGIFVRRALRRRLRMVGESLVENAVQVTATSTEIAIGSQELAKGTEAEAASLHQTAASIEQIASLARQSANHATDVNAMAGEVRRAAEGSRQDLARMNQAIQHIKDSSDQTAKVVRTIDEIAFQTNLLALNAAVEAARAGDAGRGFAVVADEVGQLAHRSAEHARTTSELIEQAQADATSGVSVAAEVATVLEQIVAGILEVSAVIEQISVANLEQAQGVEEVNASIALLESSTQRNAGTAQQFAAASQQLSAQSDEMRRSTEGWLEEAGLNGSGLPDTASSSREAAAPPRGVAPLPDPAPQLADSSDKPKSDWNPASRSSAAPASDHPERPISVNGQGQSAIPLDESELAEF